MKKILLFSLISLLFMASCGKKKQQFDASGTFETEEVIVAAEATGKILELTLREGDTVSAGSIVGKIDPLSIELQRAQIEATNTALQQKTGDASPQIAVLEAQIIAQKNQIEVLRQQSAVVERERNRLNNLVKAEAAPSKQLDDLNGQLDVLKRQIEAAEGQIAVFDRQIKSQREAIVIQNRAVLSEKLPLEKRMAQVNDQISRTNIVNPTAGTILVKYVEKGEMAVMGKSLYKVGDLSNMTLRAYITGNQLSQVKVNQTVKILVDEGTDKYREFSGIVSWIADKAEFTPKTIQTKEERANLVYAMKVKVKNDGMLKIGQYGEVMFK